MSGSVAVLPPAASAEPAAGWPGAVPPLAVVGADQRVPTVDGRTLRYANLDYAASTPALEAVKRHLDDALPLYASVHRGAGYASQVSTALYERSRSDIGRHVGARPDDAVVLTRNTTDALNLMARAVPAGVRSGRVTFLDVEHHANLLPWRTRPHECVPAAGSLARTLERLDAALTARPAALLAVTGCSNVTGEMLPLDRLVRLAHDHGTRVVVDAAQLAPHRRVDVSALGVDYLALSGHKLYAPFGAGVLVGRRDWLDAAAPYLAGGGAVREVGRCDTAWADAPQRHEGGTPNVLGVAALAAACRAVDALATGALEAHEAFLHHRLVTGLGRLDGVQVLRIWPDSTERVGVVGFGVDGHDAGLVAAYLSAEHGIGVRDGRFCAHPLLARLGLAAGALRASLGAGSVADDVDRLLAALEQYLDEGPRWSYARVDGRWAPSPDPRPRPAWLDAAEAASGASPCTT
jgi:selenocysteine lyase/cysteine desulfurase